MFQGFNQGQGHQAHHGHHGGHQQQGFNENVQVTFTQGNNYQNNNDTPNIASHSAYDHDRISTVTNLPQGVALISKSQNYFALVTEQGNLNVYVSSHFSPQNVVYSSNSANKGQGPYHLRMQDDGNLVIYDKSGQATWASNTQNNGSAPWSLVIHNNGNLAIQDAHKQITWSSHSGR